MFTDLIAGYCWGVETETSPGPQSVVDSDDDDVRLYEEVRPVQDALASGQAASMEPNKD